jgi:hypothetical protein
MGGLITHKCLRKCRQGNRKRPPILKGEQTLGSIFLFGSCLLAASGHTSVISLLPFASLNPAFPSPSMMRGL